MKYVDLLTTTADTKDNTVTFTSADEVNPSAWKDVEALASKEKNSSLLKKISTMFSNVRYLYKILGSADISALGSVTQAIATLNGNVGNMKGISSSAAITTQGQYALDAREKNASIDGTLANELSKVNCNLDKRIKFTKKLFSGAKTKDYNLSDFVTESTCVYLALLVTLQGHVAIDKGGSMYLIQGMGIREYVQVTRISGDDIYSPQITVSEGVMTVNTFDTNGCAFSVVNLLNS